MVDSVYKVDQAVSLALLHLFDSIGKIPNYNDLGHSNGYPISPISFFIIVFHNSLAGLGGYKNDYFLERLFSAIPTYDYHPDWFARDFNQLAASYADNTIKLKNGFSIKYPLVIGKFRTFEKDENGNNIPYTSKEIIEINKNRKKIGLEPMEERWEKQKFMKENKETPYDIFYIE